MHFLWQWLPNQDRWERVTECVDEAKQPFILRGYRRRNLRGTQFRWRTAEQGPPTRRYRKRMVRV